MASNDLLHECELAENCTAAKLILVPKQKDLGGFSVRRSLPTTHLKAIGPWVFFDHMGPADFPAGQGIDVRPHPHIGIATVTYLFAGEILHRDSLGSYQAIAPGDLNLMVAGSGIVHSEREREELTAVPHSTHGLQLWIALPDDKEEIDPSFYHYPATEIPSVVVDGIPVRVLMGSAYDVTSPVKTFSKTLYFEAEVAKGRALLLPESRELGVYVVDGEISVKGTVIAKHSMVVFSDVSAMEIMATQDSKIAVIGGDTLGERHIDWNFVSSRKERIAQAKRDWQEGRFAIVPGDETEFIPLPD